MRRVKLADRFVGDGEPPFIIAEAGINHNGELEKALQMISVAKDAGADAIKFQTFKAEEFIADPRQMYTYQSQGKTITESMLKMFKRYELTREEWYVIKKKCDDEKILFLSTPQNRSDLDLLLELGIPAIKVGSDDFTNIYLLKEYAKTGLPIIVSCGMADLGEIYNSLNTIGALDGYPVILLYCISQYPTPPKDVNLRKLSTLSKVFVDLPLGFSDHSQGVLASVIAVGLGARMFEKHFTLSHELEGPDHWFSEEPGGLQEWIKSIRNAYSMLGSSLVRPTEIEMNNKKEFCRILVASKRIPKDGVFSYDNLSMKRNAGGVGVSSSMIEMLIGKESNHDYDEGEPIRL